MKRTIFSLSIFVLAFALCSTLAFSQRGAEAKPEVQKPQSASSSGQHIGLLRKLVLEFEDGSSEEVFALERNNSMQMISTAQLPKSEAQKLEKFFNKKVSLTGTLVGNRILMDSVTALEAIPAPRVPDFESLPRGMSQFELGVQNMDRSIATPGFMVVPQPIYGDIGTYVLMTDFTNNQVHLATREQMHSLFFDRSIGANSLYGYFAGASNGDVRLYGETQDWTTIPFTDANCLDNLGDVWLPAQLASIPPDRLEAYTKFAFILPRIPGCSFAAIATVGEKGQFGVRQYTWIQYDSGFQNNPLSFLSAMSHEHGHMYGFGHSCGYDPQTGQCIDYRDPADIMGSWLRYPNVYNRMAMGLLQGKVAVLNGPQYQSINLIAPVDFRRNFPKAFIVPTFNADGTPTGEMFVGELRRDYDWIERFLGPFVGYNQAVALRRGPVDMVPVESRPGLYDYSNGAICCFQGASVRSGQQMTVTHGATTLILQYSNYALVNGARLELTVLGP